MKNYSTLSGNTTQDRIFLLSIPEVVRYFSSDEDRKCVPTEYAIKEGAYIGELTDDVLEDLTPEEMADWWDEKDGVATCWWWLRSPSTRDRYNGSAIATLVLHDGSVDDTGFRVDNDIYCVRPALWIDLES